MRDSAAEGTSPWTTDVAIDTVGLYCPVPIIRTAEKMLVMSRGQILEVRSDDRVILIDMPSWCRSTGHEYLGHRDDGAEMRVFVRKGEGRRERDA